MYHRWGVDEVEVTDNGGEFVNQLRDFMSDHYGNEHRLITPYYPQAAGKIERRVGCVKDKVKSELARLLSEDNDPSYIIGENEDWDEPIIFSMHTYNTSPDSYTVCGQLETSPYLM